MRSNARPSLKPRKALKPTGFKSAGKALMMARGARHQALKHGDNNLARTGKGLENEAMGFEPASPSGTPTSSGQPSAQPPVSKASSPALSALAAPNSPGAEPPPL